LRRPIPSANQPDEAGFGFGTGLFLPRQVCNNFDKSANYYGSWRKIPENGELIMAGPGGTGFGSGGRRTMEINVA
jgi:hypothetical protein